MMFKTLRNFLCYFSVYFLTCFILINPAISGNSDNKEIPLNQYGIRSTNPFVVDRFIENGKLIDMVIVPSRPNPPEGFSEQVAVAPKPDIAAGTNTISNVPALTWCFGCSATSAAMMFGHYDNSGYPNMYTGPTNSGVFPMTNATWGTAVINGETRALCPLSATRLDLDDRTTKGHVDDYWIMYGSSAPDPFIDQWTEHTHGECTGDYMGTNQSLFGNSDGSTTFYYYTDGAPLYDYTNCEPSCRDGCHGLKLFGESRGYNVETNFSQYIYGHNGNTQGFTFEDFKNEIDAGRPVLIQLAGHTVLGYGYNDTGSIVYIHDTWNYSDHSMTWGGSYAGMQHYGVAVLRLAGSAPPAPCLVTNTVNFTHSWQGVNLSDSYIAPVVIVGPTSYHGTDPGVVRLQNVTNNSFDVRFQEWLYKDGSHTQENIPYLVLESGRHEMAGGSIWEAGTFSLSGTGTWTAHAFTGAFLSTPALFLTAQTFNGSDPITVRARNVTNTGFEAALFEEEALMDGHVTEEVGYLAVYSPQLSGTVNINGTDVPYLLQAQSVDHRFVPILSSDIKLEEEKSEDSEVNHIDETVSILALGDKIFTQDISSNDGDTMAIRRLAPEYNAAMEWGTVDGVDHNWMKIPLAKEYQNPVVVAKPVSSRGGDPGVIRIRNVSYNSFELRYNEWAYLDGWHTQERVFYMVVEAGEQSVAGLTVEARKLNSSKLLADGWESITFSASFGQTPSVFTSVQTFNGGDPVTTRVKSCTTAGFDLTMDEEEAKNDGHTTETIGWIAIEKGTGNTADNRSVVVLSDSTNHIPTQISFGQSMARRFPVVVSDMITTYGSDPCFLRYQNLLPGSIDLFIQEEQSADNEMWHAMEDVSLFVAE